MPSAGDVLSSRSAGMAVDVETTSNSFTFANWYKGTATGGYLLDQQDTRFTLAFGGLDPTAGLQVKAGTDVYATGITGASDDNWNHIAWVFDGYHLEFSIYLNGVIQDVDPLTPGDQFARSMTSIPVLDDATAQMFFANYVVTGSSLAGLFDDVQVFDRALSSSEIQLVMQGIPEPTTIGLLAVALGGLAIWRRRRAERDASTGSFPR